MPVQLPPSLETLSRTLHLTRLEADRGTPRPKQSAPTALDLGDSPLHSRTALVSRRCAVSRVCRSQRLRSWSLPTGSCHMTMLSLVLFAACRIWPALPASGEQWQEGRPAGPGQLSLYTSRLWVGSWPSRRLCPAQPPTV